MPRVSNTVDQARTLLERRLRELDKERRQVEAALAGLGRGSRRGPGRPRGSGRSPAAPGRHARRPGSEAHQREPRNRRRRARQEDEAEGAELPLPRPCRTWRRKGESRRRAGLPPGLNAQAVTPAASALLLALALRSGRAGGPRRAPPQLGDAGVDALAGEVGDLEALDDLPLAARAVQGQAADDALLDAVGAVGGDGHRDPVAVGGAEDPVVDVVDRGVRGGGGAGGAAGLDDRGAALGDGRG